MKGCSPAITLSAEIMGTERIATADEDGVNAWGCALDHLGDLRKCGEGTEVGEWFHGTLDCGMNAS